MTPRLQGTVRRSDEGGGEVLLDDGTPVAFPAGAVVGVLSLARGQRVTLALDAEGTVRRVALVGT